jgi:hypothetical protein
LIAGIPIEIHVSWLAIYALITWSLVVGDFPLTLKDVPVLAYWASGLVAALLLFVSVLAHEVSHAFVGRAHGLSGMGSRSTSLAVSPTSRTNHHTARGVPDRAGRAADELGGRRADLGHPCSGRARAEQC